ncbi:MAG TPA: tRNA lysidine(34) synthetase TilS [Ilumatobacter sp.]|nr:tRNA lysidine(34) synthetase TilS [Ilumatobacter sp.]
MSRPTPSLLDELLARCTFPPPGSSVACAFSGGPDSTALVALAVRHGLDTVAHHVDHRLRAESAADADTAERIAAALDVPFVRHSVEVTPGPNLEARARAARRGALPEGALTGHTADDQAETVLLRLLRGSGGGGLSGIEPGPAHPILALRRSETEAVCSELGIEPVRDASNASPAMWRNRVRHELLPLANDIAGRDLTPILARTAGLLRDDGAILDQLAAAVDATDAVAVAQTPPAIARRALRRWLTVDGYPPDAASVERVLAVARGEAVACELSDGRRVERSRQRFRIVQRDR